MRPLLSGLICPMNRAWKLSRTPLIASQAMGQLQRYGRFTIESGLSISCMLYRGVRIQLLFPVSSVSTKGYPNYRESGLSCKEYLYIYMYIYVYIYIWVIYICKNKYTYIYIYMVVGQNSFIPERPFFANKKITFAKLSRTPCLSFTGHMLANNTSYEDSFTTCQITPENHGSLLGSLLNMQLASRNPFSGHIFYAKFTGPPPSTCTLTFARSFA